ncbi:oligosaccharide flippase family protein [Caldibacillus debilis]|jgi:stage V sporulation protein B|uniref:Membrane protein involved in the export of O-antigen and teichoic acid n=1 Tax=Caldibacillus debilis GB1 TaxID=1339248 RepID=A0A420VDC1_9BACI|nr:oligosaccharide flippase family protein [Caldibacillus debilis]RKO61323.1 Membrane protein involved in the export of O-antigen and teichoic acid [Caldibacillus debilis GB1]
MNAFVKGTLVLTASAFIGECVDFLINMTLARELGEYGIGQYQTILPVIVLVIILASMEFPVAIAKFVAERERKYHLALLKNAVALASAAMLLLMACFFVFFSAVPVFSDIHPRIRWAVFLLIPLVSLTSVARGYFMGTRQMDKIAVANLFRRTVQLFCLALLFRLFDFPLGMSIVIAVSAFLCGELITFLYLMSNYLLEIRYLKNISFQEKVERKEVFKRLLEISVPTTGMQLFLALCNTIEPFLIKSATVAGGLSFNEATEHFGMVAGVAMAVGFFPAFIAHSLMTVLVPEVAGAYIRRDREKLAKLLKRVILFTFLYGIPVCGGIYFFADPLTDLFVPSDTAAFYLRLLWPYFFLHYFSIPFQGILIGMGLIKETFFYQIWTTAVSYLTIYVFGASWQMGGVIVGMNTGALLLALLYYLTICKKLGITHTMRLRERKMS